MAMEASMEIESLETPGILSKTEEYSQDIVDRLTISQMLDKLEKNERRLIELRYFEDRTQSETGKKNLESVRCRSAGRKRKYWRN